MELGEWFVKSGYPKKIVDGIISDVSGRKRNLNYNQKNKKSPYMVNWIQTFGPATEQIKMLIKDANKVIGESKAWEGCKNVMGIISRRPKNLGNLLLHRKKFALTNHQQNNGTTPCNLNAVKQKGRPCASCPLMSNSNTVTSTVSGKTFKTPTANCKTRMAIYLAECKIKHCKKQYSGKTTIMVRKRVSGHRKQMGNTDITETDEATLAEHLKEDHNFDSVTDFNRHYTFTVLEHGPRDLDFAELRWINRMVTMRPFGLNKEKPLGVSDSLLTMLKKSLGSSLSDK